MSTTASSVPPPPPGAAMPTTEASALLGAGAAAPRVVGPEPASPVRGILLMLATGLLFSMMDTLSKEMTRHYPVLQVIWARYFFHMLIMLAALSRMRPWLALLHSRRPGLQLGRSLAVVLSSALFVGGIKFIPLADATAVNFVAPLLVTALSVPLLGEKVGLRRWTAVAIGFLSVLIVIRPGPGMVHWAVLLPLAGAVCYALYQITTRMLAGIDPWPTTALYSGVVGVVGTSLLVPFAWRDPDWTGWLAFVGLGVLGSASHLLLIRAFALAPASTLSPFGYVQLVWAILAGIVVFGDVPDVWTLSGAALIAGSGLYVLLRESHLRRTGRL
ncbi:MAG: DMT family transporter [Rhodospirillaceae bacterium]|nr:DMT family transporter [Rhodospirillaceae bacterium]